MRHVEVDENKSLSKTKTIFLPSVRFASLDEWKSVEFGVADLFEKY